MSDVASIYQYSYSWYHEVIREKKTRAYVTKRYKIKLDQIMRVLFKLSRKVTLNMMNQLFGENFDSEQVDIHYENSEFIQDDYERITGDLFITIKHKMDGRTYRYHIEFQTRQW